jgi:hypothetical protein
MNDGKQRIKDVPPIYEGVGSVKRHLGFTSLEGSSFFSPIRIFSLSSFFISTKARWVNPAEESGSTNQPVPPGQTAGHSERFCTQPRISKRLCWAG